MGVLFAYIGNWVKTAGQNENFYKLILAYNRMERQSKLTNPVQFWSPPDSHILAAKEKNKENATWLGISTHGRLGTVFKIKRDLNRVATEDHQRRLAIRLGKTLNSRDIIVPNFLKVGSSWDYCSRLCEGPETHCEIRQFFPFHFFAVDLLPNPSDSSSVRATYLTNFSSPDINHREKPMDITPPPDTCDFFAYGNSPIHKPFKKIFVGRYEFIEIISKHLCDESGAVRANEDNKQSLRNDLFDFLVSRQRYLPDPVILEYARASRVKEKIAYRLSSRFVSDFFDTSTRSLGIIFVDTANNVTFFESHLNEPIYNPETSRWIESVHDLTIERK